MDLKIVMEELSRELSPKRFRHSLNVMDMARKLAVLYGVDVEKAEVAGLLHDCVKDMKGSKLLEKCSQCAVPVDPVMECQKELLHAPLGAVVAREKYGVTDPEILEAIKNHTTGCENMTALDKIIFIADYIEVDRIFPGVEELRKVSFENLDQAVLLAMDYTLQHVISKKALIHPSTVNARNWLLRSVLNGGIRAL